MSRPTRRHLLTALGAAGAVGLAARLGAPRLVEPAVATAQPPPRDGVPRMLVVNLRGALDGLAAVVPYGDPAYVSRRKGLLLDDGLTRLDDTFALAPALARLAPLWSAQQLLPLHAVATPLRSRSHFDAQDTLENGGRDPAEHRDGWLYRALATAGRLEGAIALGRSVPLMLRGASPVTSLDPDEDHGADDVLVDSVSDLWADDPLLGPALRNRLDADALVAAKEERPAGDTVTRAIASAATPLLTPFGPTVATVDVNGWDTHAGEATSVARRLESLAQGLVGLADALGTAWARTVVLVVTEFGRTVAMNGTNGTDHGTGAAAFLVGGAVAGGRVVADWPGLRALYEDRDLRPTLDLRRVEAALLRDHLQLGEAAVAAAFPTDVRPLDGLFRS